MSETTSWTDHVMNGHTWLRFLYMLLLAPLLGCIGFMILCVALFQFFSVLASGESNPQLQALGRDLSRLAVDIVAFLTYNTECKPFAHADAATVQGTAQTDSEAVAARTPSETPAADSTSAVAAPPQAAGRRASTRKTSRTRSSAAKSRAKPRPRSDTDDDGEDTQAD